MTKPGRLFLLPAPIGDGDPLRVLSPEVVETLRSLRHFVVESERSAGRLLSRILPPEAFRDSSFQVLDEHTDPKDVPRLLEPALAGHDLGIVSEAGCPCVADPGADLAAEAHRRGVTVVPLSGPSSVLQALMASGFSGQKFLFLGYIPARSLERRTALRRMEREALRDGATRIFIEAPYRGQAVLEDALGVLDPDTLFCVAASLGTAAERILSAPVRKWKSAGFRLGKEPAVFLLAGGSSPASSAGKPLLLSDADKSPRTDRHRASGARPASRGTGRPRGGRGA